MSTGKKRFSDRYDFLKVEGCRSTRTRVEVNGLNTVAVRKGVLENSSGWTWYKVSRQFARKVLDKSFLGRQLLQPGYEIKLRDSSHRGRLGNRFLSNSAGKYELTFHYA